MPVAAPCLGFSVIPAGSLAQAGAAVARFADVIRPECNSHVPVSVSSVFDTVWRVPHQSEAIVTAVVTLVVSSADMAKHDPLDFLLDLDGEVIVQDRGYWVKIEARRRNPSPQAPHGIDYSLTLHDKYGKRVLGFDNSHAAPKEGGRFSPRRVEYDHWHPDGRRIEAYEFTDAGKLVEDFFAAVDRLLKDGGTT